MKKNNEKGQQIIQDDLTALEEWATTTTWGMKFNASKCYVTESVHQLLPAEWPHTTTSY